MYISDLQRPTGATALYDAIITAAKTLRTSYNPEVSDWIIALTDGEDNRSSASVDVLTKMLANPIHNLANVIMMGIGGDVMPDIVEQIAQSTQKGVFIFANGDKTSIDHAFEEVITVIEGGQIIVED
jgi:hypothetical protein